MKIFATVVRFTGILLVLLFTLSGCTHKEHDPAAAAGDTAEPIRVTAYSAKSELFMEYAPPVVGEKVEFLVHLTRLSDFKPVTEGGLKMVFTPAAGASETFALPAPTRPGIYKIEGALAQPGRYSLKLSTDGKGRYPMPRRPFPLPCRASSQRRSNCRSSARGWQKEK